MFITAGITKFTSGAWVSLVAVGLVILLATRIRRHYEQVGKAIALHPHAIEVPKRRDRAERPRRRRELGAGCEARRRGAAPRAERETEETPEEIHHLMIVPVASLDLASMRALAYAASLQQPVLALHVSPTEEEARALPRLLAHVGRSPAARGRRVPLPRDRRADGQLHRVAASPAP